MKLKKSTYYFLNYTWGLPLVIVGWILAGILRIAGFKPKHFGPCLIFSVGGRSWGAFSLGTTIVADTNPRNFANLTGTYTGILAHEFGHSIQNAILGPFMLFLVSIPSMVRYWWGEIKSRKDPSWYSNWDYDAVWFEGTATRWGQLNYNEIWKESV